VISRSGAKIASIFCTAANAIGEITFELFVARVRCDVGEPKV
jgi:hypothetical protein